METVRDKWTDERLDDLNRKVDWLGHRMDDGFRDLRTEMNARLERIDTRLDAMQRTMIQFAGVMIAALIALFAAQIGVIVA